jgi:hypothetical protein
MDIPGRNMAVKELKRIIANYPEIKISAQRLPKLYIGKRGLMVVDVVASRQRKYDEYVKPKLLPAYVAKASDLSLYTLSREAPTWMRLREGEALVMQAVAKEILGYSKKGNVINEDELCKGWAKDKISSSKILDIKGIGPVLFQYLRMLCGADSLKSDLRVRRGLKKLGLPVEWFTDEGILELCKLLALEVHCSLIELDQCLYRILGNEKI